MYTYLMLNKGFNGAPTHQEGSMSAELSDNTVDSGRPKITVGRSRWRNDGHHEDYKGAQEGMPEIETDSVPSWV